MKTKVTSILLVMILFMTSCSSSDDSSKKPSQLPEDTSLLGDYTGTWNSTTPSITYTDFPISFKIDSGNTDETNLSGTFYATNLFESCCGNTNDGTVAIIVDGNTITSFNLISTVENCSGSFSGSGIIDSLGFMIIDFIGNDCDGDHTGQIRIKE